ncbi:MAG: phytanoyl-CoA dioxygenase family protein [Sumerlaeia bacterium]
MNASPIVLKTERYGFAVVPDILPEADRLGLIAFAESLEARAEAHRRGAEKAVHAMRHLLGEDIVRRAAVAHPVREIVEDVLGPGARAVRAILFDKVPGANWTVPYHQDVTLAVKAKPDPAPEGFGPWSVKDGVVHVEAPVAFLERMLTIRLHLDGCGEDNGALRVLPGSHRAGRLRDRDVPVWRTRTQERACPVGAGGAIAMRPLLLHASSPALTPTHRRVLHLEYAAADLPPGLEWAESLCLTESPNHV